MTVADSVAYSRKRYIFVCAGCDLLAEAVRADQLTCSPACRVKAHRNGYLRAVRQLANELKIAPGIILQIEGVERLRPDLVGRLRDGDLDLDDVRDEVRNAFWKVLQQQIEARHDRR